MCAKQKSIWTGSLTEQMYKKAYSDISRFNVLVE